MKTFEQLFTAHTNFTLSTFTEADAVSSLVKLHGEIREVTEAMDNNNEGIAEEYVDCIMCLMDSAARLGITGAELSAAFEAKLAKNIGRTWMRNADNTYSHVKA